MVIKIPEKDRSRRRKTGLPGPPFKTLEDYIRDVKGKGIKSAWVCTRNLGDIPIEDAHRVMTATASRNPYVKKPALHLIPSFRPGLRPTEDECKRIAVRILELYGLGEHQAMIGADDNRDHFHLHIVVNVVHPKTYKAAKIREGWMIKRAKAISRQIEAEFAHILPTDRTREVSGILREDPGVDSRFSETPTNVISISDETRSVQPTSKHKTDADIHAGAVSEPAHLMRRQLGDVPDLKSWQEADDWFRQRSCEYRKKGACAVIRGHEVECKASEVSRKLSLSALTKRLGAPPQALRIGHLLIPPVHPAKKQIPELKTMAESIGADQLGFYCETEHSPKHLVTVDAANIEDVARKLSAAEARGENVLVTPLAADRRFIPIHGLTQEGADNRSG